MCKYIEGQFSQPEQIEGLLYKVELKQFQGHFLGNEQYQGNILI